MPEHQHVVADLRRRLLSQNGSVGEPLRVLRFGLPAIDTHLPNRGLPAGALHEIAGVGVETEWGSAAAWLAAWLLAKTTGPVLWALRQPDLAPPLPPCRLLLLQAGPDGLLAMEEGLRQPGLAGVVGEIEGPVSLTASRRLQLAAEASGVTGFLLRRSRRPDDPRLATPNAAFSRWRIAGLPGAAIGGRCWRLDLIRCRGGEPGAWKLETRDAAHCFDLSAHILHGSAAAHGARHGIARSAADHQNP